MITIKKSSDKKFYVVVTGDNGEVLSTSETENSKQAIKKNIFAQAEQFVRLFQGLKKIQDDTKKKK